MNSIITKGAVSQHNIRTYAVIALFTVALIHPDIRRDTQPPCIGKCSLSNGEAIYRSEYLKFSFPFIPLGLRQKLTPRRGSILSVGSGVNSIIPADVPAQVIVIPIFIV